MDIENLLIESENKRREARENLMKTLKQINATKFCGPGKFYDPESDMQPSVFMYEYIKV